MVGILDGGRPERLHRRRPEVLALFVFTSLLSVLTGIVQRKLYLVPVCSLSGTGSKSVIFAVTDFLVSSGGPKQSVPLSEIRPSLQTHVNHAERANTDFYKESIKKMQTFAKKSTESHGSILRSDCHLQSERVATF